MNKKLMLTSIVAIAFAMPAMAEPQNTSATFPADDYMQEDTTYTGQATYGNMGVYEGEVVAQAEYEDILYNIAAGQYLPAESTSGAQCTAGNFCTGLTGATYNENSAQGLTACSTLESGAYPNSVAGASANTDCYRACTTQNANIAHATAVSGNDYYEGNDYEAGVLDTCAATACESGYHVKPATALGTFIPNIIKSVYNTVNTAFIRADGGVFLSNNNHNQAYYGITQPSTFAIDFENLVMITGKAFCSTQSGEYALLTSGMSQRATKSDTIINETGQTGAANCWCQYDSYTPAGGTKQTLNTPFMLFVGAEDLGNSEGCYAECADICTTALHQQQNFYQYQVVFGNAYAICEANTITINWSDATAADISANNAGQCTYGGDVRTPAAATDKTNIGKRFKGWKFVKPTQN